MTQVLECTPVIEAAWAHYQIPYKCVVTDNRLWSLECTYNIIPEAGQRWQYFQMTSHGLMILCTHTDCWNNLTLDNRMQYLAWKTVARLFNCICIIIDQKIVELRVTNGSVWYQKASELPDSRRSFKRYRSTMLKLGIFIFEPTHTASHFITVFLYHAYHDRQTLEEKCMIL